MQLHWSYEQIANIDVEGLSIPSTFIIYKVIHRKNQSNHYREFMKKKLF